MIKQKMKLNKEQRAAIRREMRALAKRGGNPTDLATCSDSYAIALRVKFGSAGLNHDS